MASMEAEKKAINQALWLECAGPLITLPAIGSQVVYFPQGHSEQVIASTQKETDAEIPSYPNLPPQLFCLLHNITLHADQENDEVFAQMTLQPLQQTSLLKDPFMLPDLGIQPKQVIVSFSKTLTASDTSTHGGFSIPRRAAEKVFPPLDFSKTPPAQELVARDLHNNEWHFRHIYRGQPRRHLLTTGWSVFVSAKRLQAGDTVLFIRDEQGQLMLGIRRANRQQANLPTSLLSSDSMLIGVLAAAAHAASTSSRFTIFYNPRASPSEFVIPLAKYQKALHPPQVTVGMRFRMEMETEDSSTRRYMGTITGIGDLDPVRWPNSHWRSLKVGWDESTAGQRQRRVSAWEIEPLTAPFLLCNSSFLLRSKRLRPNEEEVDIKAPSIWARGEEGKFNMQQGAAFNFPGLGMDHWLRLQQQQQKPGGGPAAAAASPAIQAGYYSSILQEMRNADASKQLLQNSAAMSQFQHLQQYGQSMPPLLTQQQGAQLMHLPNITEATPLQSQAGNLQAPYHLSVPLKAGSDGALPAAAFSLQNVLNRSGLPDNLMVEDNMSYTSMLHGSGTGQQHQHHQQQQQQQQQQNNPPQKQQQQQQPGVLNCSNLDQPPQSGWIPSLRDAHIDPAGVSGMQMDSSQVALPQAVMVPPQAAAMEQVYRDSQDQEADPRSHVLFGVNIDGPLPPSFTASPAFSSKTKDHFATGSLLPTATSSPSGGGAAAPAVGAQQDAAFASSDENGVLQQSWPQQVYPPPVRTFTKVHKVGSVGRSLDMTRFKNYNDLRNELTRMFGVELDHKTGWQVVFIDNENDMLLLGDDPWDEFIGCVKSIRILSSSEIQQMSQEHTEWLKSIPVQQKQASSSSEDHRQESITHDAAAPAVVSAAAVNISQVVAPRTMSNYSDPSCISDGI